MGHAPHGCHVGSSTMQIWYNTAHYNQGAQNEQKAGQKKNYWPVCRTQKSAPGRKASRMGGGCTVTARHPSMNANPPIDAGALLVRFDDNGGAPLDIRRRFVIDMCTIFHKHNVRYFLESGTLIQAIRHVHKMPGEPEFGYFDDIDIGIIDDDLLPGAPFDNAMTDLEKAGFRVIRCNPAAISISRDGDYVDLMIFWSTQACSFGEPDGNCTPAIEEYALNTHSIDFLGMPIKVPGANMEKTLEYLTAMFGDWKVHDKPDWKPTKEKKPHDGSASARGDSANWVKTNANLARLKPP